MLQPEDLSFAFAGNEQFATTVTTWLGLLADSPIDDCKPYNVASKFLTNLVSSPQGVVAKFAELGDLLLRSVYTTDSGTKRRGLFREFSRTPIFREYYAWQRSRSPKLFSYIMTFLWFPKKAEYKDDSFITSAISKWLANEQRLHELRLPKFIAADLREILRLSGFAIDKNDLVTQHGPGSVAEHAVTGRSAKNAQLRYHPQLSRFTDIFLGVSTPYTDLALPNIVLWDSSAYGLLPYSSAVARLMFVPKNYKSLRTICMEPATFMWSQQALMNALVRAIDRSALGKFGAEYFWGRKQPLIDISSQHNNRQAALWASEDKLFATLDLSDASDSVLTELVELVFYGEILELLLSTRTSLVMLPDEEQTVLQVMKFAPMGSAVCFPIQCIIFALIAILCNHLHAIGVTSEDYMAKGKRVIHGWVTPYADGTSMFGDDIIVPDNQTQDMISLLTVLGFKVNNLKSFYGDLSVRESCGIFAADGVEIEITYYSVQGVGEGSYESILGRIALCNALFKRGYMNARNALLRTIPVKHYVIVDPDSAYASQGIAVHGYEDMPGRKPRWNPHLFRLEYKILRPVFKQDFDVGSKIGDNDNPINMNKLERDRRNDADSRYDLSRWLGRPHTSVSRFNKHWEELARDPDYLRSGSDRSLVWGWRWTPAS